MATPDSLFTSYFRLNSGGWTAGDATISVPLPDGRTIWLFGDSYLADADTNNNTLPCLFQVRNCMLVQDAGNPEILTTYIDSTQAGVLRSTFKLAPDDPTVLWPGHGFTFNDTLFIYLDAIGQNLDNLGVYVAKLQLPGLETEGIYPLPEQDEILPGRAVLTDSASGYRYIYGNKLNWIVWEPYIARMPIDGNPLAPYEYYTGSSWSTNPSEALKIMADPVSPGFSAFKFNDKYYLLTQENGYLTCGLGREIYLYDCEHPWGPFENKTLIYTIEDKFNDNYLLTYNAQAHPSFTQNGELLVSYNLNDWIDTLAPYICPSQCKDVWHDRMDADTYRPKFVRFPLEEPVSTAADIVKADYKLFPNPAKRGSIINIEGPEIRNISIMTTTGSVHTMKPGLFHAPEQPGAYIVAIYAADGRVYFEKMMVY